MPIVSEDNFPPFLSPPNVWRNNDKTPMDDDTCRACLDRGWYLSTSYEKWGCPHCAT